jgi:ubiquitin-conjugating enzyme E2 M
MRTEFPDPDDTLNFTLTIDPDEGMYKGGRFHFTFAIPQSFPHEAPKVKCTQKIYHPNIDLEGNVCLNILREDWKPVLNLQAVIVGLQVSAMLLDALVPLYFGSGRENWLFVRGGVKEWDTRTEQNANVSLAHSSFSSNPTLLIH